jgi:hypothetical protein
MLTLQRLCIRGLFIAACGLTAMTTAHAGFGAGAAANWEPITVTSEPCATLVPGAGWVPTGYGYGMRTACRAGEASLTITYIYLADPAAPIGTRLVGCDKRNLPAGWVIRGTSSNRNPVCSTGDGKDTSYTIEKRFHVK